MSLRTEPLVIVLLTGACVLDRDVNDGLEGTATAGNSDGESGAYDSGSIKLDTPDGAEGPGDQPGGEGCEKVDFLFVVDNSGSMAQEQTNLANSFPGFIATIEDTLQTGDFRIMVIDSDQNPYQGCVDTCAPADMPSCNQYPDLCVCTDKDGGNAVTCTESWGSPYGDACDNTLGAGVVFPRGAGASMKDCGVPQGRRYLENRPDLGDAFACVATVGTSGAHDERPMSAMVEAVGPALMGAGGCNEGFIRDDAILVVTILTDSGTMSSSDATDGDPAAWREALVQAKLGNDQAIAMLGVLPDNDQPDGLCPAMAEWDYKSPWPNPRVWELVESFGDHGILASVCEPDYDGFFVDAVASVIDETCSDFVPPG